MKSSIEERTEKMSSFTLCFLLSFPSISYALLNIPTNLFGAQIPLWPQILYVANLLVLFFFFLFCLDRVSYSRLIATGILMFSFALSYAFSEQSRRYIWTNAFDILNNPTYRFFVYSFVTFIISDYMHDVLRFLRTLRTFSYVAILLAAIQLFSGLATGNKPSYMTFSYNILFPTAFLWITEQSVSAKILAALGTLMIFIAGCRGALICLVAGVLLYLFLFKEMKPVRRFFLVFCGVLLLFVFLVFWNQIINAISSLLNKLGLQSRTMDKLTDDAFFDDSGRSSIITILVNKISVFGPGVFGDRVYANGRYAHNILFELMADFGWVFGAALFIAWIVIIVIAFVKSDEPGRRLLCVLLPSGCLKFFMSSSFLGQEPAFWLLLGVAVNCVIARKDAERISSRLLTKNNISSKPFPSENQ